MREVVIVMIPPTPMDARLPASISKSPPVVYHRYQQLYRRRSIAEAKGQTYDDSELAAVEGGGRDKPRDYAHAKADNCTADRAPLVRLAPRDAHRDGYDS